MATTSIHPATTGAPWCALMRPGPPTIVTAVMHLRTANVSRSVDHDGVHIANEVFPALNVEAPSHCQRE